MQQITLTLDLSALNPNQLAAFYEFCLCLQKPYVIPSADEQPILDDELNFLD